MAVTPTLLHLGAILQADSSTVLHNSMLGIANLRFSWHNPYLSLLLYFLVLSNQRYAFSASLIHCKYAETLVYAVGFDVVQSAAP
jgi:hypothetical protein